MKHFKEKHDKIYLQKLMLALFLYAFYFLTRSYVHLGSHHPTSAILHKLSLTY
jgi:hypothetical protein